MQFLQCSGCGVDDDCVAEHLELGDEETGVGFLVALGQPVGAEVAVGLVAFEQ